MKYYPDHIYLEGCLHNTRRSPRDKSLNIRVSNETILNIKQIKHHQCDPPHSDADIVAMALEFLKDQLDGRPKFVHTPLTPDQP